MLLLLFALLRQITEPTSFIHPFFPPPEIFSFWGTSTAITRFETQMLLLTPVGRKYSIWSSPLTSFLSMTLTYLLFFIGPLAIAPLPTSPVLPPLLPSLPSRRCFRIWVLIFLLRLSLPVTDKYLSLSLFSAAALSTSLTLNAAKFSIFFWSSPNAKLKPGDLLK